LRTSRTYAPEGDFTEEEKIQSFIDLTGQFPIIRVMGEELLQKLKDKYCHPISEYEEALGGVVWCIPRKVVERKTKTGKVYWIVEATDSNSVMAKIRVWGVDKQNGRYAQDQQALPHQASLPQQVGLLNQRPSKQNLENVGDGVKDP
jgi:hypothetical protein